MGCLSIFALPVLFFRWCFTNGLKGFIVLGIVLVLVIVGVVAVNSSCNKPEPKQTKIEQLQAVGLPDKTKAPYMVKTISRVYYAKEAKKKDGVVTMTGYWEFINGKWQEQKSIELPESEFGKITVSRR
jgi:hypothetical protein